MSFTENPLNALLSFSIGLLLNLRLCPWSHRHSCTTSAAGRLHFGRVIERRVPITPALRSEIQYIVDRTQEIEAALLDVFRHPRVRGVRVAKRAVNVPGEDRHCRILITLAIFTTKVVLERAGAGTQKPQIIPASLA